MKTLVLAALLLLPPIGAVAVSPEDAYLAARDRYIASFRTTATAKGEKAAIWKRKAGRGLEKAETFALRGTFSRITSFSWGWQLGGALWNSSDTRLPMVSGSSGFA
jgi:hypothetical protein